MTPQEQADHYANEIARMVGDEGYRWYNVRDAWAAGYSAGLERAAGLADAYQTKGRPDYVIKHEIADSIRAEMGGAS